MPFDAQGYHETLTQQVLLRAASEVRKGWCQFELDDASGNVCARGAILRGAEVDLGGIMAWHEAPAIANAADRRLARYLGYDGDLPPGHDRTVSGWNNAEGRTQEEVASALERAAYMEGD